MKRNLIISERKEALHAMLAMLSANMMDNELEEVSSTSENREDLYGVKLVWLDRGANGWVGCPCFVSKFDGCLPNGRKIKAVVYVKVFAARTFQMCKMHELKEGESENWREISDGETFDMPENKPYQKETYIFRDGKISVVSN